jgi:hypothetical protein
MSRALTSVLTLLGLWVASGVLAQTASECEFEAPRDAVRPAAGIDRLEVVARAGALKIEGVRGLAEIRARGHACAPNEAMLGDLDLIDEQIGSALRLEVRIPERYGRGRGDPRLDLVIEVPLGLAVGIEDSSGAIDLHGLGSVDVVDGSGELSASDIAGRVHIEDGSGAIRLRGVAGDVTVTDGSGEIVVDGVTGGIELSDGSGAISVRDVTGSVIVRRDGSGQISVDDVGGDLIVERDGTGGVSYRNVAGTVRSANRELQ